MLQRWQSSPIKEPGSGLWTLDVPNRAERVEALGNRPGQALLLRGVLHIPGRHVDG